jgi:hypothetical protein
MNVRRTAPDDLCYRCCKAVPTYYLVGLVYDKQTHTWHDDTQMSADNRQRRHYWFDQSCADKVMVGQPKARM